MKLGITGVSPESESMLVHTFPSLCPGLSIGIYHSNTGVHWHGEGPGLPWRQKVQIYHSFDIILFNIHRQDFLNERLLTMQGLVLSHSGLDHVGLDGTAKALLLIIRDGAASSALLVQIEVGRLRALWSFTNAAEGVCSPLSAWGNKCSFIYYNTTSHSTA